MIRNSCSLGDLAAEHNASIDPNRKERNARRRKTITTVADLPKKQRAAYEAVTEYQRRHKCSAIIACRETGQAYHNYKFAMQRLAGITPAAMEPEAARSGEVHSYSPADNIRPSDAIVKNQRAGYTSRAGYEATQAAEPEPPEPEPVDPEPEPYQDPRFVDEEPGEDVAAADEPHPTDAALANVLFWVRPLSTHDRERVFRAANAMLGA